MGREEIQCLGPRLDPKFMVGGTGIEALVRLFLAAIEPVSK